MENWQNLFLIRTFNSSFFIPPLISVEERTNDTALSIKNFKGISHNEEIHKLSVKHETSLRLKTTGKPSNNNILSNHALRFYLPFDSFHPKQNSVDSFIHQSRLISYSRWGTPRKHSFTPRRNELRNSRYMLIEWKR